MALSLTNYIWMNLRMGLFLIPVGQAFRLSIIEYLSNTKPAILHSFQITKMQLKFGRRCVLGF